jgi:hypothetical protein
VQESADDDAYDIFVNHGYLSEPPLSSAQGRELAIAYLTRHAYPELAAYVRQLPCEEGSGGTPASWDAFPADFQALRSDLGQQLADAAASPGCAPDRREVDREAAGHARSELHVPAALRWTGQRESPLIPPRARRALKAFNVVRYSRTGPRAAAISLSQDVDPVGEVSGGGYWLHLSDDGGRSWRTPLYLGLQQYFPYVVVARSRLPLLRERVLQIEVEVRELDPGSITFPPVGLQARRTARNVYIELPLDDIERDSDGDGLTDLLEERLLTDPHQRDTDHDGLDDAVDPLPQVPANVPPTVDLDVMRMTLQAVLGYQGSAVMVGPPVGRGEPLPSLEETLARGVQRPPSPAGTAALPGSRHRGVLYLQADAALFRGLTLPDRVVIVTPEQARALRRGHGVFYPIELNAWFNHAGTRAFVLWSAGWTGGAMKFERKDGRWQPPERTSDWITRLGCPPGSASLLREGARSSLSACPWPAVAALRGLARADPVAARSVGARGT